MAPILRAYKAGDAPVLDRLAVAAFSQYGALFSDWPAMARALACHAALAAKAEIIVAEHDGEVAGSVGYCGPGRPKAAYFDEAWPIIRMLVVAPAARGLGLGRLLSEACLDAARRDGAPLIALHTSPIMTVALPMYLRMGFAWLKDVQPIHGVPYAVYTKQLDS
ncbi:GNAT family N-acetyltransferase [Phreatobacter sp. AB_2022a]|uniref:GNAT family N-acetyltransferase n=1 Tax=Phreatobacter sp. AB_2022a TaxID=3003134 RepID=UPI002286D3EA|nr:GNAT family N-acetyltransferase [Phreatobacter sp. AB_2022a]MCZ0738712.1 GNAT family N-acetyltransferase [Phreatobacter sp. AB_2022a]